MGMLFREVTINVLIVVMLGPITASSDDPSCAPPAPKCSILKRSVCEWSASSEPVWACKGYWEPVNHGGKKPIHEGGSGGEFVESSTDGDVIVGTYEYHVPQGRQLISHHEPEVKIGTYTYPVPTVIRSADNDVVLHTGAFLYPVAPKKVAEEEAVLQKRTDSLPVTPIKVSADDPDGMLRIGTITLPVESQKIIPIGLQPDANVHLGTNFEVMNQKSLLSKVALDAKGKLINNLPLPAIPPDSDGSTEIRIGTYFYEVPTGKKKAKSQSDANHLEGARAGYHEGARALGADSGAEDGSQEVQSVQKTVVTEPRTILTQESLAAAAMSDEPAIHIGTVTYRVPVKVRNPAPEQESDSTGIGTAIPVPRSDEHETRIGKIEYQVANGRAASLKEPEPSEKLVARIINLGRKSEEESDSEVRIGTYTYKVPKSASGPNVPEMSIGSAGADSAALQFGTVDYLDGSRNAEAEIGAIGSAAQMDVQAGGAAVDLSIVSGKKRAHEDAVELREMPVVTIGVEAQSASSGMETDDSNGAVHVGQMILDQNGFESAQTVEASGMRMLTDVDSGVSDSAGLSGNTAELSAYGSNTANYQQYLTAAGNAQTQNAAYGYGYGYGFPIYYGYGGYGYWVKKGENDKYGYYYMPQWTPLVGMGVGSYGSYGNQLAGNAQMLANSFPLSYYASYSQTQSSGSDDSGTANSHPTPPFYPYTQYVGFGSQTDLCTLCKFLMSVLMGGTCNTNPATLESAKRFSDNLPISPYNGS